MTQRDQKSFEDLYDVMVVDLLKKIKKGVATAAELNVARQLLKDAGIQAIPGPGTHAESLAMSLPFKVEDDEDLALIDDRRKRRTA